MCEIRLRAVVYVCSKKASKNTFVNHNLPKFHENCVVDYKPLAYGPIRLRPRLNIQMTDDVFSPICVYPLVENTTKPAKWRKNARVTIFF